MKKLLVFVGDSGSGKTTLIAEMVKNFPNQFRKVVTCTSRPMRDGEIDGVDYHFKPESYFNDNKDLVLVKKTSDGFFYGTRKSDLGSDTHHLLLTSKPTGLKKLLDLGFNNIIVIRMTISDELKIIRLRQRGDDEEAILARLELDRSDRARTVWPALSTIQIDSAKTIGYNLKIVVDRV